MVVPVVPPGLPLEPAAVVCVVPAAVVALVATYEVAIVVGLAAELTLTALDEVSGVEPVVSEPLVSDPVVSEPVVSEPDVSVLLPVGMVVPLPPPNVSVKHFVKSG